MVGKLFTIELHAYCPLIFISNLKNVYVVLSYYLCLNNSMYLLKYQFYTLVKSLFMFFLSSLDIFLKVDLMSVSSNFNFLSLGVISLDFFFCACATISYIFVYLFIFGKLDIFTYANSFSTFL